jgi:hypothetical protein
MGINTLSDSLGQSGGSIEWTCSKGNKYKISLMTLEKQSEFERALEKRAIEKVRTLKDVLDKDEYSAEISKTIESIKDGHYIFGGPTASDALRTLWGISNLMAILIGVSPNDASIIIAENNDIGEIMEMVIERSFPVASGKGKKGEGQ